MSSDGVISVIVPVYNTADYLNNCIDSILNQTYKKLELILIDDGSNDGSERICEEYQALDSRVATFHLKRGGIYCTKSWH